MNYQLPSLASQHHRSDYNRLRYGQNGAPIKYLPLSLNFPEQFHQTYIRHLHAAEHQTMWLLAYHPSPSLMRSHRTLGPTGVGDLPLNLHDEIRAAMDEPLAPLSTSNSLVKTSMTHPINISCLVPFDLLRTISDHASLPGPSQSPTILALPDEYLVHRLIVSRSLALVSKPIPAGVQDALESALSSSLPSELAFPEPKHPPTPASISLSVSLQISRNNALISGLPLTISSSLQVVSSGDHLPTTFPPPLPIMEPNHTSLGNMFMSSCPGKKVRLTGTTFNGRSAVCRDLDTDLLRMKELGVGCIVCCLDDAELDLLGAPWPLYRKSAQTVGLDVLRLPTPEGLGPLSPLYLDSHLTHLLRRYTLKGISVLVHCRGGVGRAGVIACCWLVKLGICGGNNHGQGDLSLHSPRTPLLDYIETVISYVRRRRSPKAIESFEQVRFLVDYVQFLYNSRKVGTLL
ncbi:phosphatases II [Coprinopsis marcescibilis]|uniref:Phosphatases II n=1 Tax=Coprinopsis marcescibilis TaxID=230819 RepID=A0A5C3KYF6_COPMA|nr:phosphatases II [Coprinopsis marcescibilis]